MKSPTSGEEQQWQGYRVSVDASYAAQGLSMAMQGPERQRTLGVRGNRVIGGLFLHTTRKLSSPNCHDGSFAARFGMACALVNSSNTMSMADFVAALYAGGFRMDSCAARGMKLC